MENAKVEETKEDFDRSAKWAAEFGSTVLEKHQGAIVGCYCPGPHRVRFELSDGRHILFDAGGLATVYNPSSQVGDAVGITLRKLGGKSKEVVSGFSEIEYELNRVEKVDSEGLSVDDLEYYRDAYQEMADRVQEYIALIEQALDEADPEEKRRQIQRLKRCRLEELAEYAGRCMTQDSPDWKGCSVPSILEVLDLLRLDSGGDGRRAALIMSLRSLFWLGGGISLRLHIQRRIDRDQLLLDLWQQVACFG